MAHFAQINQDGIVVNVIVAEQDFIDSGTVGDPKNWIQTSYNTYGNQHPENRPLRKNFAGVGYTYDKVRDGFIECPYGKLVSYLELNEDSGIWDVHTPDSYSIVWKWNISKHTWEMFDKETGSLIGGF